LDSVLLSFLSVKSLDLASVAEFGSTGYSFGTPGDILMISEKRLSSLSTEQQAAIVEAGKRASDNWCAYVDATEASNIAEMKAAGLKLHRWSEDEVAELNEKTADVAATWASSLEGMGKPANAVLDAFTAALK
jgi:TRAP-type C4-dicarboxylate transport system substrate-binding protein